MRIVDVCGFYAEAGGGVRAYVRQKLAAAAGAGHHVSVIAPGSRDRIDPVEGGRIVWIASPSMPFDPRYRRFGEARPVWGAITAERPEVLEGSSPWRSGWLAKSWPGQAARALIFHQDVVAAYGHVGLDRWVPRPAIDRLCAPWWARLRALSGGFDATVVAGGWLAERLARFGVTRPVCIPFGVDRRRFDPARRNLDLRADMLARCGLAPDGKLLLAVGRFHPEKRWGVILEGFRRARAARSDLGLAIVGDGLARKGVTRAAAGLAGVHFTGVIDNPQRLAELYASADLLVHGSGAETYGLVVAEAIASGLPVLAPDAGGAGDLARRSGGALYRLGDAGDLARQIGASLSRAFQPGDGGAVARTSDHFAQLFALYQRLIAERREGLAVERPQAA